MKLSKHLIIAWLLVMIVLIIDMFTTMKGLALGFEEMNLIAAFFIKFGNIGYICMLVFGGILAFSVLFFVVNFLSWIYEKLKKEKMSNNFKIFFYYLFASVFIVSELLVIWNNIKLISG